jgi:hypothetical protein
MNEGPSVYWLAVASNTVEVNYEELKHRMVVAQGWPKLSLEALLPFAADGDRATFDSIFGALFKRVYPEYSADSSARIMWDLLNLKQGDIIVAIEGTRVVGIAELPIDAVSSYRHDKFHEYANTVSYGTNWRDWETVSNNFVPTAPAKGVQGIRQLQQYREKVLSAWKTHSK